MKREATAIVAKDIFGASPYQQHAMAAFPLLVRQALAQEKITYRDLAEELGLSNPRNLNYILGSIGTTLVNLSRKWGEEIPPLECLVINRSTGLPGKGADEFLAAGIPIQRLNRAQRQAIVNAALAKVFSYPKWYKVLETLDLSLAPATARIFVEASRGGWGGGESEEHARFKEYVASTPSCIGLPADTARGEVEFCLPSGDSVDVMFRSESSWIAVEVKSHISDTADKARGLFQCVKYLAVLRAWRGYEAFGEDCHAILALESRLPKELIPLRNALGVEVCKIVMAEHRAARDPGHKADLRVGTSDNTSGPDT